MRNYKEFNDPRDDKTTCPECDGKGHRYECLKKETEYCEPDPDDEKNCTGCDRHELFICDNCAGSGYL